MIIVCVLTLEAAVAQGADKGVNIALHYPHVQQEYVPVRQVVSCFNDIICTAISSISVMK